MFFDWTGADDDAPVDRWVLGCYSAGVVVSALAKLSRWSTTLCESPLISVNVSFRSELSRLRANSIAGSEPSMHVDLLIASRIGVSSPRSSMMLHLRRSTRTDCTSRSLSVLYQPWWLSHARRSPSGSTRNSQLPFLSLFWSMRIPFAPLMEVKRLTKK